ncbi:single-stranded DNA-binding protein [Arthrobacter psychrolactophilus]
MGTRIPVSINGNLVADPELTYGESGIAHAKLRVAVNQRFQAADGTWRDGIPVFHNVSAFRGLAENVTASLKKGDPVLVMGELEFRSLREGRRPARSPPHRRRNRRSGLAVRDKFLRTGTQGTPRGFSRGTRPGAI